MKLKELFEARTHAKSSYSVKEVKGKVDRVIATLEGKESASWTRISKQYKQLDDELAKLEKQRNELNAEIKDKAAQEVFALEDEVFTRVVETCGMTITLSKKTKSEAGEKVDTEAVVKALSEADLPGDLKKMIDGIIKANTKAIAAKETPERLTVKVKEDLAASVVAFFSSIASKIRGWFKSFDSKFAKLDKLVKSV